MKTQFSDIDATEIGILKRQFDASPFAQHLTDTDPRPTQVDIFDFDSTLFFSPLLNTTLWHPILIEALTTENLVGPGWWRDLRSLELGPFKQLEKSSWKGFWNERTVEQARKSLSSPTTLTVVLTGRRYQPFHRIIPAMLESKGMAFDIVGLRPDPEKAHANIDDEGLMLYNTEPSVFRSTMEFKIAFILHLLHRVPSIHTVRMWDDRVKHVKSFRSFLFDLVHSTRLIRHSHVTFVHAIRPKYNPDWEREVVNRIIQSHNDLVLRRRKKGIDLESDQSYNLVPEPVATIISLSEPSVERIRTAFSPTYLNNPVVRRGSPSFRWGGEQPVFFGDKVVLSTVPLPPAEVPFGGLDAQVDVLVVGVSNIDVHTGMHLQVLVKKRDAADYDQQRFMLPVYYKPSECTAIVWKQKMMYTWKDLLESQQLTLTGTVSYACLTSIQPECSSPKSCGE